MSKKLHPITDELLDQLLANYQKPEDLIGAEGILKQLTKKLVERALDAELTHHLGYDKHQPVGNSSGNTRNGFSRKKLKGEFGELPNCDVQLVPTLEVVATDAAGLLALCTLATTVAGSPTPVSIQVSTRAP